MLIQLGEANRLILRKPPRSLRDCDGKGGASLVGPGDQETLEGDSRASQVDYVGTNSRDLVTHPSRVPFL